MATSGHLQGTAVLCGLCDYIKVNCITLYKQGKDFTYKGRFLDSLDKTGAAASLASAALLGSHRFRMLPRVC